MGQMSFFEILMSFDMGQMSFDMGQMSLFDNNLLEAKFQVCINIEEVNLVSFESPFFAESNDTKFIYSSVLMCFK